MEHIIAKLLHDFEHGHMSRRQLIQSLTLAATAAAGAAPRAAAADSKGFKAIAVNHISFQVADYGKTRDFYADLLGMKILKDTGRQCNLAFGDQGTWLLPSRRRDHLSLWETAAIPRIRISRLISNESYLRWRLTAMRGSWSNRDCASKER